MLLAVGAALFWDEPAPAQLRDVVGRYQMKGDMALRPTALSDDGEKTYIEWRPDQPLPAVFAIDARGREEMVDGYMRGSIFTIDRIYSRLRFRIDKAEVTVRRMAQGEAR
ncbi:TrbG/VirB9 family P-type conjugative transfer protein [Sphingobium olei]|uniref:TrbG/VirB9 family P-type conjugative transfer protein n=1 Tax=Sphingobium olei TaxID=420955 RepID=A0ABW3P1D4_9SPHN